MNLPQRSLRPPLTLADIYGPERIYNPRPSHRKYDWLSPDAAFWDCRTGAALTVAGAMPVICSRGMVTPAILALLEQAGIDTLPPLIPFGSATEYEQVMARTERENQRLVFQHVHAPGERRAARYWINPELLSYLNDKAHLSDLAPAEHVPKRRLIPLDDLPRVIGETPALPVVVKGSGPQPNGGGGAVVFVRQPTDLQLAQQRLACCTHVVVEQFLEVERNYCLTFAGMADGAVRYLGASEQVTNVTGNYQGNWLDPRRAPPEAAIDAGREIMRRAVQLGYRGIAGFDVVVDVRGAIWALDLNFRLNGSTPAILWQPALREWRGPSRVARYQRLEVPGPLARWLPALRSRIKQADFFPLSIFDPVAAGHPTATVSVEGMWFGASRREADARRDAFLAQGTASAAAA